MTEEEFVEQGPAEDAAGAVVSDEPAEVASEPTEEPGAEEAATVEQDNGHDVTPSEPATADGSAGETEETSHSDAADDADELSDAIAEAGERVDEEPSLGDIAPGTVVSADETQVDAAGLAEGTTQVSWWPFAVYVGVWLVAAGVSVWLLSEVPAESAIYDAAVYPFTVLGGIILTVAGPLLTLAVWFTSWTSPDARKGPLFVSALLKGAVSTLAGVAIWWVALILLDQIRLGSFI